MTDMRTPCQAHSDKIIDLEKHQLTTDLKMDEIKTMIEAMNAKMDKFIDSSDGKFSGKWVEKAMGSMIGFLVLSILGALVGLVVVPNVARAFLGE